MPENSRGGIVESVEIHTRSSNPEVTDPVLFETQKLTLSPIKLISYLADLTARGERGQGELLVLLPMIMNGLLLTAGGFVLGLYKSQYVIPLGLC